jgi:hypothetical protein
MIFTTESGSNYELDLERQRIRRLSGSRPSTNRQGSDGEWKEFFSISVPTIGQELIIVWSLDDNGTAKSTLTSPLVSLNSEN